MYYRDCAACFEVGGEGGGDSKGAIARRQAGYYLVI